MPKNVSSESKSFLSSYRFLLDANISGVLVALLKNQFHIDVVHVTKLTSASLPDSDVVTLAKQHNRVIITHDLDYGEIYYLKEQGTLGVIMLRIDDQSSESVLKTLASFFSSKKAREVNLSMSLVVLTKEKIRVFSP